MAMKFGSSLATPNPNGWDRRIASQDGHFVSTLTIQNEMVFVTSSHAPPRSPRTPTTRCSQDFANVCREDTRLNMSRFDLSKLGFEERNGRSSSSPWCTSELLNHAMNSWEKNPEMSPMQEHLMLTLFSSIGSQWSAIADALNSVRRSVTPAFVEQAFKKLLEAGDERALAAQAQANSCVTCGTKQQSNQKAFRHKRRRSSEARHTCATSWRELATDEVSFKKATRRAMQQSSAGLTNATANPSKPDKYFLTLPSLPAKTKATSGQKALCAGSASSASRTNSARSDTATTSTPASNLAVSIDGRNPLGESTCRVCLTNTHEEDILLCDNCGADHHKQCLQPPLATVPPGAWFCPACDIVYGLLGPMGLQGFELKPTSGDPDSSFNRMRRALGRIG